MNWTERDEQAVNTLRGLALDMVDRARSGHPGLPLGAATFAYVLWTRHLRHNPRFAEWPDRDRFVLSAGHGSALLYALLHVCGYDLPLEELTRFRQWGSRTPGHPERGHTPGVETTTGPLGQGLGNAVGMAIAERWLAARFNRPGHEVVDHRTYVLASDGDLMEGVAAEAASLAGHLRLSRLVVLYDANGISIDGPTSLSFTEDVGARFAAYGWRVAVVDGHDAAAIDAALGSARTGDRPSLVVCRTRIGFGSPKEGSASVHGTPITGDDLRATRARLGISPHAFFVPEEVREHVRSLLRCGSNTRARWEARLAAYRDAHPQLARELEQALSGELPAGWAEALPRFAPGGRVATRKASGAVLQAAAKAIPFLVGGSADLTESNSTALDDRSFERDDRGGRYLRFGVREHAMGAVLNGLALHGGVRPFGATFLVFSDYLRPSIRLAALMRLPVTYLFTHDSIAVGEDGPTHQPVEQLMSLRLVPGLRVVRPADAEETRAAWRLALERPDGPTALVLSRQDLPVISRFPEAVFGAADGVERGAYVLAEAERRGAAARPDAVLIATGSEVHACLEARRILAIEGVAVRVVSMPCCELFDEQPYAYREEVLPSDVRARIAVEAGATRGWERYVGDAGTVVGIDRFGASGPGDRVLQEFGFSADAIAGRVRQLLRSGDGVVAAAG